MKTILDTIVENKKLEVLKRKAKKPLNKLVEKGFYHRATINPSDFFHFDTPNIIAEFKRKSPSKGILSEAFNPASIIKSYKDSGASAASILTDRDFFGGSFQDLENTRQAIGNFPLLRKDFIIDSYQIHEAKAYGADIILLIASILDKKTVKEFATIASSIGLFILLEVHSDNELEMWTPEIGMIGVNNRDLKNFSVNIEKSVTLFPKIPNEAIKISESGLHDPMDVMKLFNIGYQGFLIGERFMTGVEPGMELHNFIHRLKHC